MSDNTARGFLDDIIANPDDDAPRLIFADWLDDHGDSDRAEFIRAQVERAALPRWDARHVRLLLRERALLKTHEASWREGLPEIKGVTWGEFRRGFVATATFRGFSALAASASACRAAVPLEAVYVGWPKKDGDEVDEPIAGLRELTITGRLVSAQNADRLADSPLLSTLRVLNLSNAALAESGFSSLLASPHLKQLRALRLPYNYLGNTGIELICASDAMPALEELDLSEESSYGYGRYGEDPIVNDEGMEMLAEWDGLAKLRVLALSGNDVGEGLEMLLESPRVTGLKELVLRGNSLSGDSLASFGAAGSGLQLDVLDLGENMVRESGVGHLAKAPCLGELKVLNLDRCEMRVGAAKKLAKAPFMASLRVLNVSENSFGPRGLSALLDAEPPQLHTLMMLDNDLGDDGAEQLAKSAASNGLLVLNLIRNSMRDRAAEALAATEHLQNLLALRLGENGIGKPALRALTESPLGKRLTVLDLREWEEDGSEIPF